MLPFRATCDTRPGSAANNQEDGIVKQAVERVNAGQAVYTPLTLKVYDYLVLGFSNRFLWRCPTSTLVDLYDRNASEVHLDVGVGTGYFLDKTAWPVENPDITLLDLNANSLEAAATRIARYQPTTLKADIFEPIPLERKYRSVGLCYLLHCLPGPISEKGPVVFDNVSAVTTPRGKIFGATIVQGDTPRSYFAQALMNFYNRKGIFSNEEDTIPALRKVLSERFDKFSIEQHGTVAVFEAENP